MSGHPVSYPARCATCNKFMPVSRSQMVREYSGTQMNPDCDDLEVGICQKCENAHTEKLITKKETSDE